MQILGRGSGTTSPTEAKAFFVSECINFDVLKEKDAEAFKPPP